MLSVIVPAHNEEANIVQTLEVVREALTRETIDFEIIVVDDNSSDATSAVVAELCSDDDRVRLVRRSPPAGFGRAIRTGVDEVSGDCVVICMADLSDDPEDVVAYYRKLQEGYDCVFGSRFMPGGSTHRYPKLKLLVNRIVNRTIQVLFLTRHNDLTNAFKAYRTSVIRDCGPYRSSHFNITLEMSLSALIRRYHIAAIPIRWHGRDAGVTKMRMTEMGRRYLSTLLMMFFQRILVSDDLLAETIAHRSQADSELDDLRSMVGQLEEALAKSEGQPTNSAARAVSAASSEENHGERGTGS